MRMSLCVRAAASAGIALAGFMGPSTISFGFVGVSSAEAAQFYTRKRINGVWVEGRFPKEGRSVRAVSSRKVARTRTVRRVTEVPASATLAALPAPVVLPPVDLRRERASVPVPTSTGTLRETSPAAGLPDVEAALVISAVGPVPPADESGLAAEERLSRLRRALEARAFELKGTIQETGAGSAAAATGAPANPLEVSPAASSDRSGRAMSTGSVAEAQPAPAKDPGVQIKLAPLVPRSVSYDFETGIKTTVYESSVVREPFDRAAMRALAATR